MRLYDYRQAEDYITRYDLGDNVDIIPGVMCDTYIIYHANGVIEVFEERYLNEWSSALTRRHYRNGKLPARLKKAIEETGNGGYYD